MKCRKKVQNKTKLITNILPKLTTILKGRKFPNYSVKSLIHLVKIYIIITTTTTTTITTTTTNTTTIITTTTTSTYTAFSFASSSSSMALQSNADLRLHNGLLPISCFGPLFPVNISKRN